jgi:phosphinothricin acetyltransferase
MRKDCESLSILPLLESHWPDVRRIYEEGIATGQATFETAAPDWERFDATRNRDCRLVGMSGSRVVAWAVLMPFSSRPVYRGVAEASVYVAAEARGTGVGTRMLAALVGSSEENGYWTLLAKIFPENTGSLALVRKFGFREVGVLTKIAQDRGVWRDVVFLERRIELAAAAEG